MKLLLCWILLSTLIACLYGSRRSLGYMLTFFLLCLVFGPLGGIVGVVLSQRNNNPPPPPYGRKRFDIERYRMN